MSVLALTTFFLARAATADGGAATAKGPTLVGRADGPAGSAVAFSPDNKLFATAGGGRAQLWRPEDLRPVHAPLEQGGRIDGILFTPDSKMLLTFGALKVRSWDVLTGKPLWTLTLEGDACCATISPDGSTLAMGVKVANGSGSLDVFELATRVRRLRLQHPAAVRFVTYSRNGTRILTANEATKPQQRDRSPWAGWASYRVWDAKTGRQIWHRPTGNPNRPENWRRPAQFSPDGQIVALVDLHDVVGLTDAEDGKGLVNQMTIADNFTFTSVCFNRDGKRLLTSGTEVTLWDTTAIEKSLRTFGTGYDAVFSPKGGRVLTSGYGDDNAVWDLGTGKRILAMGRNEPDVPGITAYSADGLYVAAAFAGDGHSSIWRLPPEGR